MEDQTTRSVLWRLQILKQEWTEDVCVYSFLIELLTYLLYNLGAPALRPYIHGYFISLKILYATARVIVKPFAYDDHRAKMFREKMNKMSELRIRAKIEVGIRVNKDQSEKILRDARKNPKESREGEQAQTRNSHGRGRGHGSSTEHLIFDSPRCSRTQNLHWQSMKIQEILCYSTFPLSTKLIEGRQLQKRKKKVTSYLPMAWMRVMT